jgi:hypothetical protein
MLSKSSTTELCPQPHICIFFFGSTGVPTHSFTRARQAFNTEPLCQLYFFVLGIFQIRSLKLFAWAGLELCLLSS